LFGLNHGLILVRRVPVVTCKREHCFSCSC